MRASSSPGTAPAFEASAGYVYTSTTWPYSSRVTLRGVDATGLLQFNPVWGALVDFTYARAPQVPGTGHSESLLSALIGPQFFLIDRYRGNIFVHGLVGSALVDSAVMTGTTSIASGYVARFSYALGGGAELTLRGPFAFRISADYQRTTFVNPTLAQAHQHNIRGITSLVYRFGARSR